MTVARAVWVSGEPPDVDGGGGAIRQAHLLRALAARAETTLVLAGRLRDPAVRRVLTAVDEVDARVVPRPTSATARRIADLRGALSRAPHEARVNAPVRAALAPAVARRSAGADVVVVEHAGLAGLAAAVGGVPRRALTLHNVASVTAAQLAALAPGRRQAWLARREAAQARGLEAWAVRTFDTVFTVSPEDAAAVPGPTVVVPNGVDTERFAPTPLPHQPRLVFTGSLAYLPNVDGLRWFCDVVLPLVRAEVPGTSLDVVGRAPVPEIRALEARAGVRVFADVPAVAPHLASARVAVVPLRMGSGTRLKALEAMAAGRPVVGTSVGLAGLAVRPGRDVLVADGDRALAAAVVRALRDDALAAALSTAGRRVAERYAWDRVAATFVSSLGL